MNSNEYIPKNNLINEDSENFENIELNINANEYVPAFEKLKNRENERQKKEKKEIEEKIIIEKGKRGNKENNKKESIGKKEKNQEEEHYGHIDIKFKEDLEKNIILKRKYYEVFKSKKVENKYTLEYLMQFKSWIISNEIDLLPKETLKHINKFKEIEVEFDEHSKSIKKSTKIEDNNIINSLSKNFSIDKKKTMEHRVKKDFTKEYEAAEEFKKELYLKIKDDPKLRDLRALLNMLTEDNYEKIKKRIIDIIQDRLEYQEKFVDVFFQKAILEKIYIKLYGKLCKELDNELKDKNNNEKGKEKISSFFRIKLLERCRDIFKNNKLIYKYIKEKDPDEREIKFKNLILGNANFLCELITSKILSKKITPDCINFLFEQYEKEKNEKLKLINIEEIIIFADKIGELFYHENNKKNKSLDENIEKIFKKLENIKNGSGFPARLKYKIINLIEKKKNNFHKTEFEKSLMAKSKKELQEEKSENKKKNNTQDDINEKIKHGLNEFKEFIEEGDNEEYPWKEIIYLYEHKKNSFSKIIEGYIISCGDFIENINNIKIAKKYINELVEHYKDKFKDEEKKNLRKKLLSLIDIVKDIAFETPKIYDIYSYTIFIFIKNKLVKIKYLENIIKDKKEIEEENFSIFNNILVNIYKYYKKYKFKDELKKFDFIKSKRQLFDWIFEYDESDNEEEEEND